MRDFDAAERPIRTWGEVRVAGEHAVVRMDEDAPAVALNATALALWELCDGQTTVEEMVTAVCTLFTLGPQEAWPDVVVALSRMHENGLIR